MKFAAVTACQAGVAHTYMAAESLEKAGKERGIQIRVETQGSIGIEHALTAEDIAEADAVILTNDMPIRGEERFAGKKIVRISVSDAVKKAPAIIKKLESMLQ
ncbi:MAG: PTS fructose-like transporter subunit IIB [Eubacteriales bacterium]|nr:PTS fructose-like transporter subunit IIB [Eubacteriales bacterium]